MVFCIISDIHANLEALSAVLDAVAKLPVDEILCLGDLVGYNADPGACAEEVLSRAAATVRGNHDKAASRLLSLEWFNSVAKEALLWTRASLPEETLERIAELPEGPEEPVEGVLICHGTPMDEDRYMVDSASIGESFRFLKRNHPGARVCFHGHTHAPLIARMNSVGGKVVLMPPEEEVSLEEGARYLINPGSVGQPRDGNPQASFGILDTERWIYRTIRVAYAIRESQRKILEAGLPRELARRLEEGW